MGRVTPPSTTETPLRIVFVGHVDHGKSTLVGRLFHDTGSLPEGKLEQIQAVCQKRGVPFEWAFLMDALQAERDQNITIDTSQIWFRTDERPYVIIDAPGHREFLKNMITGAASADAAFLLIAANEGVREQSRRHGYMLSLLGIRQVVVLVNKMDLVDYDQSVFDAIEEEYREFLAQIGLDPIRFIPVSAREGDNVAHRPDDSMSWYDGPTIVEALDRFDMPRFDEDLPLRFPLQDVYRFDERRILAGRIESGTLQVGDEIVFQPYDKRGVVKTIERWNAAPSSSASAGESVGITLTEQIFVERGHVGAHATDEPEVTNRVRANLFWMGRTGLKKGANYKIKLATQELECKVTEFVRVIDASTLETVERPDGVLKRDDVAEVVLETKQPLAVDLHNKVMPMGRFVVVDGFDLAGGGIITGTLQRTDKEISIDTRPVAAWERFARNGHKGAVVWVGPHERRAELVAALERRFFNRGLRGIVLDERLVAGVETTTAAGLSLALAGMIVLTDLDVPPALGNLRVAIEPTDAVLVSVDLGGGEADVSVNFGSLALEQAVEEIAEQLLPHLRQTWTVDAGQI